ncbi:hypothetical protein JL720_12902 [Aureococcus anophagefferens]|nr:hypothetical protein JL720_12902 [Aureococcus anophagefferens]
MAKESPRRLLEACGRGDAAQVQTILSGSRVDVNADERGWTPAYVAAQNGHTAVLKALIGAGCDVNASREDGAAPALIAAEKGHGETLEALVAAGCDVDHANGEGWTPALFAAQENQTAAASCCARAAREQGGERGWTPTAIAAQQGAKANGETACFAAAKQGHADCVGALIRGGVDVNQENEEGWTPVYMARTTARAAAWNSNLQSDFNAKALGALIAGGCDVDRPNKLGWTPACIAAQHGHLELFAAQGGQTLALKALIKAGADVNLAENDGWSPASSRRRTARRTACSSSSPAAGVNLAANDGASPLYIAAQQGQTAALNVLIANGALVDAATRDGATACRAGRHKGDSTTATPTPSASSSPRRAVGAAATAARPCYIAAQQGQAHALAVLLAAKCDANAPNNYGVTPLLIAAQEGRVSTLAALVVAGCDVNKATYNGETPCYIAAYNGHTDALAILLAAGADADAANQDRATPETIARQNGHTDVVATLRATKQASRCRVRRLGRELSFLVCGKGA